MGLWGWVWGGRSRSQLVKTNGKRRCTCHHIFRPSLARFSGAMGELQSALAVGLEIMLRGINIFTLDDLAAALRGRGDAVAAYISSGSCRRAAFAAIQAHERQARMMATVGWSMEAGSAAWFEIQLLRTELAAAEIAAAQLLERSAVVEVDVAESMLAEALQIGDEQVDQRDQPAAQPHHPQAAAKGWQEEAACSEPDARPVCRGPNAALIHVSHIIPRVRCGACGTCDLRQTAGK